MLSSNAPFDLAVIGAGPAGAAAAITAARAGARVAMFEAKAFPRHKVCGEFISAEALGVLSDLLGSAAGQMIARAPRLERTRLFLGDRMVEAPVSPPAVSISRYELDAALWRAAEAAGVVTCASNDIASVQGGGAFELKSSSGIYVARAVIVAAGRWSQFTTERVTPPGPKWIGLKAHFRESKPTPSTDLYFFHQGYCGVQPVSGDAVNACAMVRSDRAASLAEVFALHPRLASRAARWTPVMSPVSTAPLIYRKPQPMRDSLIFAGDAAAFIDPFVGDGISIALRSGRVAAECLGMFFAGTLSLRESVSRYELEYGRHFAPLLSAASRVRSLLSLPPLARAAAFEFLRIPGVMPMIIRKTRRAS